MPDLGEALLAALEAYEKADAAWKAHRFDGADVTFQYAKMRASESLAAACAAHLPALLERNARLADEAVKWAGLYALALDGPGALIPDELAELHRQALAARPKRSPQWSPP